MQPPPAISAPYSLFATHVAAGFADFIFIFNKSLMALLSVLIPRPQLSELSMYFLVMGINTSFNVRRPDNRALFSSTSRRQLSRGIGAGY
jgi:hypothetical protein